MFAMLNSGWLFALALIAIPVAYGWRGIRELRRSETIAALSSGLKALGSLLISSIGFLAPVAERIARLGDLAQAHQPPNVMIACGGLGGVFVLAGTALRIYRSTSRRETGH